MLLLTTSTLIAQEDVTKFLGIPIDGTKQNMIKKLENKGFEYNATYDYLEGEFNGYDVNIHVVTNNNKVYRIMVEDVHYLGETDIRIRFNNLCDQFKNNDRYFSLTDYKISDNEDISYEMSIHNKRYEASFYQMNVTMDSIEMRKDLQNYIYEKYGNDKALEDLTENEVTTIGLEYILYYLEKFSNNSVWFMINDRYGKYNILMYYDNLRNKANGEDL